MKLLKKILVPLAVSAAAISAHADVSTPDLSLSNNWEERMYSSISGGYIQSRDVKGGGAHISLGYELAKSQYGTHNAEFEVGLLFQTGSNSKDAFIPSTNGQERFRNGNSKVDFDQFPLMFNYRFIGNFGDSLSKFTWYAGAGLGVNIINYKNRFNGFQENATGTQSVPYSWTQTKTEGEFAAQGFAGIGYEVTQDVAITLGGRILGTQRYTFSPENALPADTYTVTEADRQYLPNQIRTNTIHWMVEAGVTWKF